MPARGVEPQVRAQCLSSFTDWRLAQKASPACESSEAGIRTRIPRFKAESVPNYRTSESVWSSLSRKSAKLFGHTPDSNRRPQGNDLMLYQ